MGNSYPFLPIAIATHNLALGLMPINRPTRPDYNSDADLDYKVRRKKKKRQLKENKQ